MKNILVIGGAGYIGSHVVYDLNDRGYNVIVYDDLSTGYESNIDKRSHFIKGDIFDYNLLNKSLENIDTVVHLAALKDAGESMIQLSKYANHNIIGSLKIIELCIINKVRNFIFSSSAAVYGNPKYLPVDEKHPLNPINYYGYTKLCIERNLSWYNQISKLNIACLRYFNAAGYDLEGRVKCLEKNAGNLLPVVLEVVSGKRSSMQVFGDDYGTDDGTCLRDYIHVSDLARAHSKSIDYLQSNDKSLTLNLSTGNFFSVFDVIKMVELVSNRKVNYKVVERRPGDPEALYSKSLKANDLLNWAPKYSDLKTLISSMWNVYK